MKRFLLPGLLALALAVFLPAFTDPTTPISEEDAIKAVIIRETETFFAGQAADWKTTWSASPTVLRTGAGPAGHEIQDGAEALNRWAQESFDWFSKNPERAVVSADSWVIRHSGNVAWATYNQSISFPNVPQAPTDRTKQMRCLEKQNGKWVISALHYMDLANYDTPEHHAAIRATITGETQAFFRRDHAALSALHRRAKSDRILVNMQDGAIYSGVGWEAIDKGFKELFAGPPDNVDPASLRHDNFDIRVAGNRALVFFDQYATDKKTGKTAHSKEMRLLTYDPWDGAQWKIDFIGAFYDYRETK